MGWVWVDRVDGMMVVAQPTIRRKDRGHPGWVPQGQPRGKGGEREGYRVQGTGPGARDTSKVESLHHVAHH